MLYLTGSLPSKPETLALLRTVPVGLMATPLSGYAIDTIAQWTWAADNGCFSAKWEPTKWLAWLERNRGISDCLFAAVPDVVGSHRETIALWPRWFEQVRSLGYKAAFVAQNGCSPFQVPWDTCDAVFLGGDDHFKLGIHAERISAATKIHGKWLHMGRVNSFKRLKLAESWGCDSVDGTFLAFGPDGNTQRLLSWFDKLSIGG